MQFCLSTLGMVRKLSALIFILVYSLAPYSLIGLNNGCKCGCNEFICTCCQKAQHPKDKVCFTEYDCSLDDDSYEQPPATGVSFFRLTLIPILLGYIDSWDNGIPLPGYRNPPMKPPPS